MGLKREEIYCSNCGSKDTINGLYPYDYTCRECGMMFTGYSLIKSKEMSNDSFSYLIQESETSIIGTLITIIFSILLVGFALLISIH